MPTTMAASEHAIIDPEIAALRDVALLTHPKADERSQRPVSVERLSARRLRQLSTSPLETLTVSKGPLLGRHRSMFARKDAPIPTHQPSPRSQSVSANLNNLDRDNNEALQAMLSVRGERKPLHNQSSPNLFASLHEDVLLTRHVHRHGSNESVGKVIHALSSQVERGRSASVRRSPVTHPNDTSITVGQSTLPSGSTSSQLTVTPVAAPMPGPQAPSLTLINGHGLLEASISDPVPSSPRQHPLLSNRSISLDTTASASPLTLPLQFDSDEDADQTLGADPAFLNLNFEDDEVDLRLTGTGVDHNSSLERNGIDLASKHATASNNRILRSGFSFDQEPDVLETSLHSVTPTRRDNRDNRDNHDNHDKTADNQRTSNGIRPLRPRPRSQTVTDTSPTQTSKPPWQGTRSVRERRRNSVKMVLGAASPEQTRAAPVMAFQPPAASDFRVPNLAQSPTTTIVSFDPNSGAVPDSRGGIRLSVTEGDEVQISRTYSAHRQSLTKTQTKTHRPHNGSLPATLGTRPVDPFSSGSSTNDVVSPAHARTQLLTGSRHPLADSKGANHDTHHSVDLANGPLPQSTVPSTTARPPVQRSVSLEPRSLSSVIAAASPQARETREDWDMPNAELQALASGSGLADITFRPPTRGQSQEKRVTRSQVSFHTTLEEHAPMVLDTTPDRSPPMAPTLHHSPALTTAVIGCLLLALLLIIVGSVLAGINTGGDGTRITCFVLGVLLALAALVVGWKGQANSWTTTLPRHKRHPDTRLHQLEHASAATLVADLDWSQLDTFDI
eukprot:m.224609 g.224609  ORF g.224609 m.224609 type:complete len:788 (+) comp17293_c0_seq3:124-2487(+)